MASVYDSANSPYTFREDDQAEAERQNRMDLATLNAVAKVTGNRAPAGAAAPGAMGAEPPPTPEQMGVKPAGQIAGTMRTAMASFAPAQAQAPEGIQDFIAFGSNPMETALRERAAKANMEQLDNPAAAFDLAAGGAREDLDIAQRNQREGLRDDLTRTYGGNASQVQAALRDADQQAILERRGLNRDLTAGRAQASQQGLTTAIQNALGFAGIGSQEKLSREQMALQAREAAAGRQSQEKIAFAGLAQQDRALAQNAMQFGSEMEFRKSEAAAGRTEAEITRAWQAAEAEKARTSQEKVAFAGLAQQDKALAMQAMQFASEMEFRKSEAVAGRSEAEITRAWQAAEAEKARGSQEKIAFAGLSLQEKQLAQQAMQFGSELEFRKSEAAAGRTEAEITRAWQAAQQEKQIQSQEKIAFAGLDLERTKFQAADANAKKGLDLEASAQALTKMGMDQEEAYRYAALSQAKSLAEKGLSLEQAAQELTKQGMEKEDARYFAGLAAQEKQHAADLVNRVDVARLQIGSAERLQANQQVHEAAQADLTRTLQREMQGKEIETQRAMQRTQQDFESMMADKGFLNAKDIETLKQEFATELQRNGFSQETALQAAELQARSLEAESSRVFEATQADLQRRFMTGERIGSEAFATSLQGLEAQQQDRMARLTAELNLTSQAEQAKYNQALAIAQQAHEKAMQQRGIGADQAARMADQIFQTELQAQGFTQQQALQATALQHEAAQADKQLAQQYSMFMAETAQEDAQFAAELGLNKEQLRMSQVRFVQEMDIAARQMGIQEEQWASLKQDQTFAREVELAMMGVQMWNGEDPADVAPFAERLAQTMGRGLGMDPVRLEQAIKGSIAPEGTTNPDGMPATQTAKQAFAAFDTLMDTKAGSISEAAAEEAKTYAKLIANTYSATPAGTKIGGLRDVVGGANMDAAVTRLKGKGTADAVLRANMNRDREGDSLWGGTQYEYKGTPEFINYTLYVKLLNSGLKNEADAKQALVNLIGQDKATAALALEGKK